MSITDHSGRGLPHRLALGVPELFLDDALIAHQRKLVRRWLPAKVFPKPVIEPDRPWESRTLAFYGTVIDRPEGGYRLYYTDWAAGGAHGKTYLATSEDGFRWVKPELGLIEHGGSSANNIVLAPEWYNDGPSLVVDPGDPDYPYKLITFESENLAEVYKPHGTWGLYGYRSRDGIRWIRTDPALCLRAGDRTNLMVTKPDGKFVMYTRHVDMFKTVGTRAVYRSESEDFRDWTEPELVLAPDLADDPDVELYGMSVFERNGWFFGLLEYWRSSIDTIEVHLVFSRDGKSWTRTYPRVPFIAPTYEWNSKWNSCASNGPIIVKEQMVFYFGGRWTSHHYDSAQQYGAIGYASLPLDRFCALEATAGGHFVTVPIEWPGGELVLNADTRESFASHPAMCDGEIAVELLDAQGNALPNWSGDNKALFRGNTHMRCGIWDGTVRWPNGNKMNTLRGQVVSIRFHLKHARLFTIAAVEQGADQ